VERLAEEAAALARATAEDPAAGLPEDGFAAGDSSLELSDPEHAELSMQARIDAARRAEAAARAVDPRIANSEGSEVSSRRSRRVLGNTQGFLAEYESAAHALACMPIAVENGQMQVDWWTSRARRWRDLEDPAEVGRIAAARALRRLGARQVATCEVPVIFEARTAQGLLGHLAACANAGSVYRGVSFLAGRLGETRASPGLTVLDDALRPGGLGSRPFDGEGLPSRRSALLERGRLASFLVDTYSGRKLGLASTGSAARGAGGAPHPAPSNLWIEPGEASLEEIIADTPRGLLVTYLFGHGFNPVTGDFSRGAAGHWIEDGRLAQAVHEVTVAGNLAGMLRDVDAVGRDLLWQGPIGAPSLRIARMTVAGS
jgi:PmbA protein